MSTPQSKLKTLISKSHHESFQVFSEFIRCKSYVDSSSSGEVSITGMAQTRRLEGSNLLVVEDVIDTGRTMEALLSALRAHRPSRLRVSCLLRKRHPTGTGYLPDYLGFEVPDRFVVGHGFDYNDNFRDMLHVCVINKHGLARFRQRAVGGGAGGGAGGVAGPEEEEKKRRRGGEKDDGDDEDSSTSSGSAGI